jgi:hypothetical protein
MFCQCTEGDWVLRLGREWSMRWANKYRLGWVGGGYGLAVLWKAREGSQSVPLVEA